MQRSRGYSADERPDLFIQDVEEEPPSIGRKTNASFWFSIIVIFAVGAFLVLTWKSTETFEKGEIVLRTFGSGEVLCAVKILQVHNDGTCDVKHPSGNVKENL